MNRWVCTIAIMLAIAPGLAAAEGRRTVTVQVQVGADEWVDLDLTTIGDFERQTVDRVLPEQGTWPPPEGAVVVERSTMDLLGGAEAGDTLTIRTPDQKTRRLLLAGGAFDRRAALELQHELLMQKSARTAALVTSVERAINAERTGVRMTKEETFEVFGDFDPAEYEDEVKERWGESDAYKESARRTARYTKADWERFKAESEQIGTDTARLMDEGVPPTDPRAMDLAEQARLQIDTWFYPCSHDMHVGLAGMYIADPRFTATYEKIHEGMAQYWHDAILANASRQR